MALVKKIHLFLTLSTLVLFASCATTKENKKLAYSHFKIGVSFIAKADYGKGLEQLLIARDLDPSDPITMNHLGLAYFFLNEFEHSIISLKSALSIKPQYTEAHTNIGRVYISIKDFKEARRHLGIAASDLTYAHKDKILFNIGLSYFMESKFKKSQSYFLKAISMNRNSCLAYNYYGRTQIELENFSKAAKALDQAVFHCRRKGFDEPHYYSAISLFRMGYKSKAIARLQEGKKLFPNGPNHKKIIQMMNLMKITEAK